MEASIAEGMPTLIEAEEILKEAGRLNPGSWVEHFLFAGKAVELIAQNCNELNGETAIILGMLHDIGRRVGVTNMRHSIDGYNFA